MKEGPSESVCRDRFQTAPGCFGSMVEVVSAGGKGPEKNRVRCRIRR